MNRIWTATNSIPFMNLGCELHAVKDAQGDLVAWARPEHIDQIAAAPDMKIACEGALSYLLLEPHLEKDQLIRFLRGAIARAEGKAK